MKSGTIYYKGGSEYKGKWKNGKWEDDEGTYTRSDGTIYKGPFRNGVMSGNNFEINWQKAGVTYVGAVA